VAIVAASQRGEMVDEFAQLSASRGRKPRTAYL
jgi:hypothetical protein